MRISFVSRGSTQKTENFLHKLQNLQFRSIISAAGDQGVAALSAATPRDTGLAAASWDYKVEASPNGIRISWYSTDLENGFNVAAALQYGYGTGTGGYVQGRDYINPAMRPIFDRIADQVWKAVTSL